MIILDTETTGLLKPEIADLAAQPHIIEIAMIRLTEDDFQQVESYQTLLKPGAPLDDEVHKKITGLTNADLAHSPTFLDVYYAVCDFLLGERVIVAHNLAFDLGMLTTELRRIGKEFAFPYPPHQICTVDRTKHIKGKRLKMTELYEMELGRPLAQTHRAMEDAEALAEIVRSMQLTWQ